MVFELICLAGLIFVALTLPKALRRRNGGVRVPPVVNDVTPNAPHARKDTNVLAADRAEYFDMLEKHSADPLNIPAPIPPSKPHPYWGNEADVFGNKSNSDCNETD